MRGNKIWAILKGFENTPTYKLTQCTILYDSQDYYEVSIEGENPRKINKELAYKTLLEALCKIYRVEATLELAHDADIMEAIESKYNEMKWKKEAEFYRKKCDDLSMDNRTLSSLKTENEMLRKMIHNMESESFELSQLKKRYKSLYEDKEQLVKECVKLKGELNDRYRD